MRRYLNYLLVLLVLTGCTGVQPTTGTLDLDKEEYYVLRGINYYQEGKLTEALSELEKAYSKNNMNPITLREMGLIYGELGNIEKSKRFYKMALELNDRDEVSLKNLALLNYAQGDYEKANEYLEQVTRDNIDIMTIKLNGLLAAKAGKDEEAYEHLKEVVDYQKELDLEVYIVLRNILEKKKDYLELYQILEDGYKKNVNDEGYVLYYTDTLVERFGELDKASVVLKRYLATNGGSDLMYFQLAKVALARNDLEIAKLSVEMISEMYKYDLEYLKLKRDIYKEIGNEEVVKEVDVLLERLT